MPRPKTPERDNNGVRERQCSDCGQWLPATEEWFYKREGGLQSWCKDCYRKQRRRYREANREIELERARQYRETNREAIVERRQQYYESNREIVLERGRQYRQNNREVVAEHKRRYRQNNRETIAEHKRRYYQENRESILERDRQYRRKNGKESRAKANIRETANGLEKQCTKCERWLPATAEYFRVDNRKSVKLKSECKECRRAYEKQYRDTNQEEVLERTRQWRKEHPEYCKEHSSHWHKEHPEYLRQYFKTHREEVKAYQNKRRALIQSADGSHTAADIRRQYKAQRGRCYYCGAKVGKVYHVDHVIPLSRGGSNGPENLVIACPTCNLSKHDKLPHEWAGTDKLL